MNKEDIAECVVMDGIKYDCISYDARKFNLKCSLAEVKEIHELYHSRRRVPIHFRGINRTSRILEIIETVSRDSKIDILIETA